MAKQTMSEVTRVILNALCEAGQYDLADAVWDFQSKSATKKGGGSHV